MYVYNNTRRLINPGGKMPLIPGENKITKEQAAYLSNFDLTPYTNGKNPMLVISEEKIVEVPEDTTQADEAAAKLKNYVEEGGDKIMDASDGIPEDDEGTNDLAARIAARVGGK